MEEKIQEKNSKKIIEASDLPLDDKVYLKKGRFGYRVVHPAKNPDGSWNIINLIIGGWDNFFLLLFILAIILVVFFGSHNNVTQVENYYKNISDNPYQFCKQLLTPIQADPTLKSGGSFNLSTIINK